MRINKGQKRYQFIGLPSRLCPGSSLLFVSSGAIQEYMMVKKWANLLKIGMSLISQFPSWRERRADSNCLSRPCQPRKNQLASYSGSLHVSIDSLRKKNCAGHQCAQHGRAWHEHSWRGRVLYVYAQHGHVDTVQCGRSRHGRAWGGRKKQIFTF